MASLTYFTGPMNCGKSTLALQIDYTESGAGRRGLRFTCLDRGGQAVISSRIGLSPDPPIVILGDGSRRC